MTLDFFFQCRPTKKKMGCHNTRFTCDRCAVLACMYSIVVGFGFTATSAVASLPSSVHAPASSLFQANRAQAFERRGDWSKALSDYEGEDHGRKGGGVGPDECLVSIARLSVDGGVRRYTDMTWSGGGGKTFTVERPQQSQVTAKAFW